MAITLTNLIPSPSMEGSGWSGGTYSTSYAYDGQYSMRLDGTASTPEVTANTTAAIALNPSHIYYARVYGYQTTKSAGTVGFYWPIAEPNFQEGIPLGDAGKWNLYSGRNGRSSFSSGSYQLRLDFNNSNVAGTIYFDGCMLIDLTAAFGAGNEPTKEWLDTYIPYFAGTRSFDISDFAPDPPGNLRQTGSTYSSISIAWDSVLDAQSYRIYKDNVLLATVTSTSYTDDGMLPDETHVYAVSSVNENGEGDKSVPVSMSTQYAYYKIAPVVHAASIVPNPSNINTQGVIIAVSVSDDLIIYEPEYWYAGEIMAGE